MALQLNKCLEEASITKLITKGKIIPIQKDLQKVIISSNY